MSLVGRSIRATLHRLGDALELFEEQRIYLVTQAANDLNITFVVDEEQGDRLVRRLHDVIVRNAPSDHVLGPTWEQIHGVGAGDPAGRPAVVAGPPRRTAAHCRTSTAAPTSTTAPRSSATARQLLAHPRRRSHLLRDEGQSAPGDPAQRFAALGLAFECVSQGECERVLETVPGIDPGPDPVHAELRARAASTNGRSSRAST